MKKGAGQQLSVKLSLRMVFEEIITISSYKPGVIRTNFEDGLVVAEKSQDPNSPY